MGRRSTVAVLPEEIVAEVNRLIRDGCTIDEILRALTPLGVDVSRAAMGRYVKSARETREKYTQAQEVAKAWLDARIEDAPNGDVARLLPEMLRTIAFQTLDSMGGSDKPAKAMEIALLSKALKDLGGATKDNVAIELKMRELRSKTIEQAAEKAHAGALAQGMGAEQAAWIRENVLGIK